MTKALTLFSADDGVHGAELWVTDGTPGGTALLKDVNAGPYGSNVAGVVDLGNGRAMFRADDGVNGAELWITDGTAASTRLLRNIKAGADGSYPQDFTRLGDGRVLFLANDGIGGADLSGQSSERLSGLLDEGGEVFGIPPCPFPPVL